MSCYNYVLTYYLVEIIPIQNIVKYLMVAINHVVILLPNSFYMIKVKGLIKSAVSERIWIFVDMVLPKRFFRTYIQDLLI